MFELPAIVLLGFWFLMQLFSAAGSIAVTAGTHGSGGVAFMAHVAGFVFGGVSMVVLRRQPSSRWEDSAY